MMLFLLKFVISVIALLAAFVLLPQFPLGLLRLVLRGVGWVIRKRTQARRAAILARVRADEEELHSKQPKTTSTSTTSADDEDWEKVDTSNGSNSGESSGVSGSQTSRQSKNDDWAGVIGFFHPFW
jgi:alpha-1,2-mannosyltransferase